MPIELNMRMANGQPLIVSTPNGITTSQLHIDLINSSPTATASLEWAAANNVPVTIRDGTGSMFQPGPHEGAPNGRIVLDASLFTPQAPGAQGVLDAAVAVVAVTTHEITHARGNLDGMRLTSPATFATPGDYVASRAAVEGYATVGEAAADSELVGKSFNVHGATVVVQPTSYAVGGDWGTDAVAQAIFQNPATTSAQKYAAVQNVATLAIQDRPPSTAGGMNYQSQALAGRCAHAVLAAHRCGKCT
jgi:hypothetical protein